MPGLSLNEVGEIVENGTTPNIHAIAAALAVGLSENGGLINDATLWVSWEDRHPGVNRDNLHRVINSRSSRTLAPEFASSALSFQFVAGLDVKMPSTTPIAFTRGLQPDGAWSQDKSLSVYGDDGGHIVFLGGNVQFFRNVHQDGGSLKDVNGEVSANILETIDSSARIFSYPATATGAVDGMPGIAQP